MMTQGDIEKLTITMEKAAAKLEQERRHLSRPLRLLLRLASIKLLKAGVL